MWKMWKELAKDNTTNIPYSRVKQAARHAASKEQCYESKSEFEQFASASRRQANKVMYVAMRQPYTNRKRKEGQLRIQLVSENGYSLSLLPLPKINITMVLHIAIILTRKGLCHNMIGEIMRHTTYQEYGELFALAEPRMLEKYSHKRVSWAETVPLAYCRNDEATWDIIYRMLREIEESTNYLIVKIKYNGLSVELTDTQDSSFWNLAASSFSNSIKDVMLWTPYWCMPIIKVVVFLKENTEGDYSTDDTDESDKSAESDDDDTDSTSAESHNSDDSFDEYDPNGPYDYDDYYDYL